MFLPLPKRKSELIYVHAGNDAPAQDALRALLRSLRPGRGARPDVAAGIPAYRLKMYFQNFWEDMWL